jgi:tetratricopeptide (TPR) repeat protein
MRLALGFVVCSLVATPAAAQEGSAAAETAPAGGGEDSNAAPAGGEDAEARSLFEAGRTAYDEGRYDNALRYFQQAYELSGRPELLFNVGSAADRLRRDDEALAAFEAYLEARPGADNRRAVEARIAVLREEVSEASAETDSVPSSTATTSGSGAAPWILVVGGGIVAASGGVLLGLAASDKAAVENAERPSEWADFEARADRVPVLSAAGAIALGVGVALAAVGLVWALGDDGEDPAVTVTPTGVAVRGSL